jgi:hydroxyacylglutathione hydrolase
VDITQILNTHEHRDHTGGNDAMSQKTGAKILAHKNAQRQDRRNGPRPCAGDVIKVGKTVELEALDTPGHTMSHICLLVAYRQPGAFLRRHAVQRRRGQLPQRRHPAELYNTFRRAARAVARWHQDLSGPRLHREQSALHARSRARQYDARDMLGRLSGQDPATRS